MTRKEFRRRVDRAFQGLKIDYAMNEAEYLANVTSAPESPVIVCQSSPYRNDIGMFWHGRSIGLLSA